MSTLRGRQFDQIQIFIQQIQRRRINCRCLRIIRLWILHHPPLQQVHLLEEFLCRLDGGEVVGSLLLIDAEGVAEEVHGCFHVVVSGVENVGGFAVSVLFGAYSVDVLLFALDYDCFGDVEEVLYRRVSQVTLDHSRCHQEELMHSLLHTSIIPALCYRNGSVFSGSRTSRSVGRDGRDDCRGSRSGSGGEEVSPLEERIICVVGLCGKLSSWHGVPHRRGGWCESIGASDGCKEKG
mmetsp:Transcript_35594/g.75024  ORF Transcript_35594/g.75024 Transcript_35594/m.75024 type:complete len:237 (+) Transcript_35594:395-1105(+)